MDIVGKLKKFFQKEEKVQAAYLFGSQATGKTGPLSDIDIAVILPDSIKEDEKFNYKLQLISQLESHLETNRLDLVDLKEASLLQQYNIIKDGKILKNHIQRPHIEYKIIHKYLDRQYYDQKHAEKNLEKIAKKGLT